MAPQTLSILPNFSINKTYKFILYLSTSIFALSLFFPVYGVNLAPFQALTLKISIISVVVWFILGIIETRLSCCKNDDSAMALYTAMKFVEGLYLLILVIILVRI